MSDGLEPDCSTDTEQLIERNEREVRASLMLPVEDEEEEIVAGPS